MATSLGKMLDDVTGRFWWVLVVSDSASAGLAHILRVMRGRGVGRSFVDFSFSGTLAECREFLVKNGGGADGILLVDCCTPVKIVSDEVGTVADFPGYKLDNLDCVESISGDFSVVALKSAVENFVADIEKYGFRILRHVPSVLVVAELLDVPGDQPCLFTNCDDGFVRLLLSSGGKIVAGYKVAGENAERLSSYVREHFFLKETVDEQFSMELETLAKAVAEDAWAFRTDGVPAFHTLPDKDALRRIREAAFSRRILKFCLAFVSLSFIALFAFRIGASIYIDRSQSKIQGFKARVQKQKELSQVLEQLESDRAVSESFLKHRSHVATSLKNFVVNVTDNVWITSWNASRGNHSVQGYAITPEDLSEFLSKLEKERNLVNVRLKTTEKTTWNKMQVVRFSLSAEDVR
ncbi:PilN domain-containing protein [Fibrobacter succinogenes]|uniref:PilN domain-containing protein n=1 Tax=Fibrobacter succinogenes TaxID=833 RepID=UPI001568AEF5|nr:PilN domain-containing protein [Fibrobacter succinogenes]